MPDTRAIITNIGTPTIRGMERRIDRQISRPTADLTRRGFSNSG